MKGIAIVMKKRNLPILGLISSALLFWMATAFYPGGTSASPDFAGYSWSEHFISTLFRDSALNGAANTAKPYAVAAMLVFCASVAAIFWSLSRCVSGWLRKIIAIGGVGSMVYAGLAVVTPMHDLLVTVALAFFVPGFLATLRLVQNARWRSAKLAGLAYLVLVVVTSAMYYGNLLPEHLAAAQKAVFVLGSLWLACVYQLSEALSAVTPNNSSKPTPLRGAA
ncbi:hypothetical protein [Lysobacter sp. N42]|uniref:hypothetical protein n=1 Tax=Lysobacter sp. N42 TaxID=2545719 RepID=UPI0010480734|nr:hypothetical protein [Lysobacter sp. N42]TCZ80380.1 hypothetical protein EYQ95_24765 [Lysobacter sp. N42]